ncbi:oxygenase MpaB family protein [Roseivirga sp.]|uniref:oxygenase MpaB family protein n=1 Tax=Roseivirga sp. TaxID=1964215 RepID=UPI003B8AACB3
MKYSEQLLNDSRVEKDDLADKVISNYFPKDKALLQQHLDGLELNNSFLNETADVSLKHLLADVQEKANSFSDEELSKGQAFFNEHASDIMLLLGFMSLPYCYAAQNGAEVLVRSQRILNNPEQRLMDTAEFVFDVTHKDAFKPNGKGLVSILKVRLLHAATRWYIGQDETWKGKTFGEPVNQEDMAGTNLSFSLLVLRGLRKLGRLILPEKAYDYINYWNKIGILLGQNEGLLPESNKEAAVLERKIRKRQFGASEAGTKLTQSLLNYYEMATKDTPIEGKSKTFMNFLVGSSVSNMIGLEINDFDRIVFRPYQLFISFKGYFFNTEDSYAKAYARFKENKA